MMLSETTNTANAMPTHFHETVLFHERTIDDFDPQKKPAFQERGLEGPKL